MISIIEDEITYKLGKNAKENFNLIDSSHPDFWWFHLDEFPSGHCIIESSELTKPMIRFASQLVKENSKLKNNKKVRVVYTQIKNIQKTKILGEVKILNKANIINI